MTRVLVVDDEPDILESTEFVLHSYGFDVATLAQASRIIATLRKDPPEILMQDVNMPGLDIDALVRRIRDDPDLQTVHVVLFTASDRAEEIARRVGADGLILKPFDAAHIKEVLEQLLTRPPLAAVKP